MRACTGTGDVSETLIIISISYHVRASFLCVDDVIFNVLTHTEDARGGVL